MHSHPAIFKDVRTQEPPDCPEICYYAVSLQFVKMSIFISITQQVIHMMKKCVPARIMHITWVSSAKYLSEQKLFHYKL
jgi:hypothetical protein